MCQFMTRFQRVNHNTADNAVTQSISEKITKILNEITDKILFHVVFTFSTLQYINIFKLYYI